MSLFDSGHKDGWGYTYGVGAGTRRYADGQVRLDWDHHNMNPVGGNRTSVCDRRRLMGSSFGRRARRHHQSRQRFSGISGGGSRCASAVASIPIIPSHLSRESRGRAHWLVISGDHDSSPGSSRLFAAIPAAMGGDQVWWTRGETQPRHRTGRSYVATPPASAPMQAPPSGSYMRSGTTRSGPRRRAPAKTWSR